MNYNEELNKAIKNQDLDLVKLLVKKVSDINFVDIREQTALMWACQTENIDIVTYLINKGANINYKNSLNETALTQACDTGNNKLIKVLLENNVKNFLNNNKNQDYIDKIGKEINALCEAEENLNLVKKSVWFTIQKHIKSELKRDIKEISYCDDDLVLQKLITTIAKKRSLNEILKISDTREQFRKLMIELKEQLNSTNELLNLVERFEARIDLNSKKAVFDTIDFVKQNLNI